MVAVKEAYGVLSKILPLLPHDRKLITDSLAISGSGLSGSKVPRLSE